MKKVFALVLVAVLALSAVAFADEFVASVTTGPQIVESTTEVQLAESDVTKDLTDKIAAAEDINTVFATAGADVTGYQLAELLEIKLPAYEGEEPVTVTVKFDASFEGKDIIVMLGLIEEVDGVSQVSWQTVEAAVEGDAVKLTVTPEQAAAIKAGNAVLAVLCK
jgi:hypothetical protein